MSNRTSRTPKKEQAFLSAMEGGQSVSAACKIAGFGRSSAYEWREADPAFRAAWDAAVEQGTDELEDIAFERAKNSSDTLLIFLLKARRPDKFKERISTETRLADDQLAAVIGSLKGDPDAARRLLDELKG